jgi:hypothetical protein
LVLALAGKIATYPSLKTVAAGFAGIIVISAFFVHAALLLVLDLVSRLFGIRLDSDTTNGGPDTLPLFHSRDDHLRGTPLCHR